MLACLQMGEAHCLEPVSLGLSYYQASLEEASFIMPQKVDGKFYPLEISEWGKACRELTKAQLGVLLYIRCVDPFNDGYKLCAPDIAKEVGISRQAVYKAITVLLEKELIQQEESRYGTKILGLGYWHRNQRGGTKPSKSTDTETVIDTVTTVSTENDSSVNVGRQLSTGGDTCKPQATVVNIGRQTKSKTQSEQVSQVSHTLQTYSDLINTLSDSEREEFESYVEKDYGEPIKDYNAFLHGDNLTNWWHKFVKATGRVNWKAYPKYEECVAYLRLEGHQMFILVGDFGLTRKQREQFVEWAMKNNLLEVAA